MNETKRERARDLFEEGAGATEVMRRLGVSQYMATTWREEFSHCLTCGTKLLRATGQCGFCEIELSKKEGSTP